MKDFKGFLFGSLNYTSRFSNLLWGLKSLEALLVLETVQCQGWGAPFSSSWIFAFSIYMEHSKGIYNCKDGYYVP